MASTLSLSVAKQGLNSAPRPPEARPKPLIETLFLLLVVLAPLPFGSNRPVWWSAIALGAAALLAWYGILVLRSQRQPSFGLWRIGAILLPAFAVLAWATLQAAPLGPLVHHAANPLWELGGRALGKPLAGAVSLDPHESLTGVLRLGSYLAIFWLALELGRQRPFADRLLRWIAYGGMAYAIYGLALHMMGVERILWVLKTAYLGALTSTFVNRNSYATYAVLGLLAGSALLIQKMRSQSARPRTLRRKIVAAIERLSGPAAPPLLCLATILFALLLTGSRMGAVSGAAGLGALIGAAALARLLPRRQTLILTGLIALGFLAILAFNGGAFVDRLETKTLAADTDARADIYGLTVNAIADNPVIGTGLGTFPAVFALYRDDRFDILGPIGKAHNSYLGNALELGIPAVTLLLAALAAIAETLIAGLFRRKRGKIFPALGLAALCAVALHSLVDFSLEIPAVSVTFAALIGVCCGQSHRTRKRKAAAPKPALRLVPAE